MTAGRGDAAPARLSTTSLLIVLLALLTGCGIGAQSREEPVPVADALPTPPRPPGSGGDDELVVYFVAGARLEPVTRSVPSRRPQDAVDRLLAGPTRAEAGAGLRTALSPQHLTVLTGPDGGTVTVAVTRSFTTIGGGDQLLAVAQVVWTVTQFPRIDDVRFLFEGALVAVPTDEGLTSRPVDRADYASIAPRPDAPTGTPETSPSTPGSPR
ncbi:hypothetical protein E4P41_14110 [Geodermatophilus sp. DF01-2]|uniref:GerMN domain-containing protein n=1 Tax=Geodermatophilus sp. DF01-2 TaxID=2559610 RepID=UPI001073D082|nr:GerMN domain-containing protein [Geodermatophilus sp. DF01_2]TFV57717.1 hypothetical protein E4P41_14110 [Geodermatophilus sp. DF01_2]